MVRWWWVVVVLVRGVVGEEKVRRCGEKKKQLPRLAYLILAHDAATLESTGALIDAVWDETSVYYVHVDRKYAPLQRSLIEKVVGGRENVEWAQLFDVQWARWSMIEPTLWAMEKASRRDGWDVFINLSGDSWPVLTPLALRQALGALEGLNFVTSSPQSPTGLRATARSEFGDGWHKKQAYPPRVPPDLEPHYGSQWMILTRVFVESVLLDLETPSKNASKLRDWFLHGRVHVEGVGTVKPHIPDETFFPTLLHADPALSDSIPRPLELYQPCRHPDDDDNETANETADETVQILQAAFYIRMDEHYPWSPVKQRYLSGLEHSERPWGPYFLGAYDLLDIRNSGAFFVRKVSAKVDPSVFHFLPVHHHSLIPPLGWPPHHELVVSTPNPRFTTITRGKDAGCVRVAESIHCPPHHQLRPDVHQAHQLLADFRAAGGASKHENTSPLPPPHSPDHGPRVELRRRR